MRIGIRSAISALVLTSIVVSAIVVHLLWWRTASRVSQTLADINDQIVSAVGDQLQSITTEARSASIAVRALLTEKVLDIRDAKQRKFVFLSQLQARDLKQPDAASSLMIERCKHQIENPTAADRDGTTVARTK